MENSDTNQLNESLNNEISEIKQDSLVKITDFLSQFDEDLKEISILQDNQRQLRLHELKKSLVEKLINTSAFKFVVDENYFNIFYQETMKIYSLK